MLEETDESSSQLAHWIISQLDIKSLLGAMHELWQAYSEFNFSLKKEHLRNSVFRAYHVLRRIGDYKNLPVNKLGINNLYMCNDVNAFVQCITANVPKVLLSLTMYLVKTLKMLKGCGSTVKFGQEVLK